MKRIILASLVHFLLTAAATAGPPSSAETRHEFRTVCEKIRNTENAFYGRAQIPRLENLLRHSGMPPMRRIEIQSELATHLLRLGKNEQAVALLNETLEFASKAGISKNQAIGLLARLGVAALRMGEVKNCVGHHGPEMCLLPIDPAGQHTDPQGATLAIRAFEGVLAGSPNYPLVPWLLNVAAMTVGRYPNGVPARYRVPLERMQSAYDIGRFHNIAGPSGIHVMDVSGGAIMDDFTGDGYLDIITSSAEPCAPLRFFENNGRGGFLNRSVSSGLDAQLGGINLTQADYDNDGDLDLLILRGGWMGAEGRTRNSLMRNRGIGADGRITFEDVTQAAGLAAPFPTQVAAWADYDLDGHLDLFLGNEGETTEQAFASQLFRNQGDGTFLDLAASAGVRNFRYVKGATWGDVDNDGDPDLYVSNFGANRLFINRGKGADGNTTFEDVAPRRQLTEPEGQSFGSWFFDYDNDGWLDLFVASYQAGPDTIADYFLHGTPSPHHPLLYHGEGGGDFREVSALTGLTQPSAPMGHNFGDLDNDGYLDFYLGTGWPPYEALMPNLMYRNDGGRRFVEVTYSGGFGHLQKGHGIAFGDFDNDGDQDVFQQMGGAFPGDAYPSSLYENPGHGNHFLVLMLRGKRANRAALGARIRVDVQTPAGRRSIHTVVTAGGSFGGSTLRSEIGLGKAQAIEEVEIRWPLAGAKPERLGALALDGWYEVHEGEGAKRWRKGLQ